jgi:multiple sugar transport system substrate-binding protein
MARARVALGVALLAAGLGACTEGGTRSRERDHVVRFWGLGREGEVVKDLVPEFERENPGVRVVVQQIPWTAAHEKLLTGFVGGSPPDLAQLGNTWIPEFAAIGALEPLDPRVAASRALAPGDYFEGIWKTNAFAGATFGIPWYVDTRVLFYRSDLLRAAGHPTPPQSWAEWLAAMRAIRQRDARSYGVLLPLNEPDPLFALALQQGALLSDDDTRGAFAQPPFRRALGFYAGIFAERLAPAMTNAQIANVWDEFARGLFAFYVSGPWNIGEFRRRLPRERQADWATAPLPGPDGPGFSTAGGSSLVIFRRSPRKAAAWQLIEFLSDPATMQRFHALTGNLPPRRSAWRSPELAADVPSQAFASQLERVRAAPKLPEWERIFQEMQYAAARVVQRTQGIDAATTELDASVDALLEKRRWLRTRAAASPR